MENQHIAMEDILYQTHIGLERQGPGSAEMTRKTLSYIIGLDASSQTADLGCGRGQA